MDPSLDFHVMMLIPRCGLKSMCHTYHHNLDHRALWNMPEVTATMSIMRQFKERGMNQPLPPLMENWRIMVPPAGKGTYHITASLPQDKLDKEMHVIMEDLQEATYQQSRRQPAVPNEVAVGLY